MPGFISQALFFLRLIPGPAEGSGYSGRACLSSGAADFSIGLSHFRYPVCVADVRYRQREKAGVFFAGGILHKTPIPSHELFFKTWLRRSDGLRHQ